jgi:hypothetical protein
VSLLQGFSLPQTLLPQATTPTPSPTSARTPPPTSLGKAGLRYPYTLWIRPIPPPNPCLGLIYYPDHARRIKPCAQGYLRRNQHRKSDIPASRLIVSLRSTGRHEGVSATVVQVFPILDPTAGPSSDLGKRELAALGKEEITRRSRTGRVDEGPYALFPIGWW